MTVYLKEGDRIAVTLSDVGKGEKTFTGELWGIGMIAGEPYVFVETGNEPSSPPTGFPFDRIQRVYQ